MRDQDEGFSAQYPGQCGYCGKLIAANRSTIVKLDTPLLPPPATLYARSGTFVSMRTGRFVTPRALTYAHARCGHRIEDLEALALERREELAAMRRESLDNSYRGHATIVDN